MSKFKILIGLLIAMSFILPNCSARIPASEFVLGYIKIMDSMDKVKKIYGEPFESVAGDVSGYESRWYTHYYGNGDFFVVVSRNKNRETVFVVNTTANNGIATKAGIKVGMTKQQLISAYGYPDDTKNDSEGRTIYFYRQVKPEGVRVFADDLALAFILIGNKITGITLSGGT